jgi:hypothetical protein
MTELGWRRLFVIAAVWNLVGGVIIYGAAPRIFATAGLGVPDPAAYFHAWIALFMTFGIGYYLVSRDLHGRRDIVLLGIIGKFAFSVIFIAHMLARPGTIPALFLIPVVGDLVFVVLFALFLRWERRESARASLAPAGSTR